MEGVVHSASIGIVVGLTAELSAVRWQRQRHRWVTSPLECDAWYQAPTRGAFMGTTAIECLDGSWSACTEPDLKMWASLPTS